MYSIPSDLCDCLKDVYEAYAAPIRRNCKIFAENARIQPLSLIRCNKEASGPEAAGSFSGSTRRMQVEK